MRTAITGFRIEEKSDSDSVTVRILYYSCTWLHKLVQRWRKPPFPVYKTKLPSVWVKLLPAAFEGHSDSVWYNTETRGIEMSLELTLWGKEC